VESHPFAKYAKMGHPAVIQLSASRVQLNN
jgi:hypothetical protein